MEINNQNIKPIIPTSGTKINDGISIVTYKSYENKKKKKVFSFDPCCNISTHELFSPRNEHGLKIRNTHTYINDNGVNS